MSLKSLLTAGFAVCILTSAALAAPTIKVTPNATVNANGNRVWTIQVIPDATGANLPSALAVELPFTHVAGSATQPVGIIDDATHVNDTNTQAASAVNDSWYYNQVSAANTAPLWNITDTPVDINNFTQNNGANPFTASTTDGLYVDGANLFAALGSTIMNAGTTSVNTLQIVTNKGAGILRMGAAKIGQAGVQTSIATKDYYVPADWNGDGVVGSADFNLLLGSYGQVAAPAWDGFDPVAANRVVGSADFNFLLQNYGAGQAFGSGSGSAVPEPTSIVLLGLGLVSALISRRRR